MYCLIAVEPGIAEIVRENLRKCFSGWRFEVATDSRQLFGRAPERPDVVLVSRFLPGDPVETLRRLPAEFSGSRVVLLVGTLNEHARAYMRLAEELGLTEVVTGKLPGDRSNTVFTVLSRIKEEVSAEKRGGGYGSIAPPQSVGVARGGPGRGGKPGFFGRGLFGRLFGRSGRGVEKGAGVLSFPGPGETPGYAGIGSAGDVAATGIGTAAGRPSGGASKRVGYAAWLEMISPGGGATFDPATNVGPVLADGPLTSVVGFYSGTKGGVGKTTCSANLAAWLVSRGYRVAVVDADPSTRGVTVLAFGSDETRWPKGAAACSVFGGVVVYPPQPAAMLPGISGMYDYVLLDFGTQFNSTTLDLLGVCGTVVLVTIPEQLAVNVISRFMYRERNNVRGRLCLVVNRVRPRAEVPPWRVGEILGLPVLAILPETDEVGRAAKKGTLPVLAFRRGVVVKGISVLWDKLCLETSPSAGRAEPKRGNTSGHFTF